jgi:uncharacterized protein (TIGR02757 family)
MEQAPPVSATLRELLDAIYERFNRWECVAPDPVEFVHRYEDRRDRELVALVASSLAFGRVRQIHASVQAALDRLGPSPWETVCGSERRELETRFDGFVHRFCSGVQLASLLSGARRVMEDFGSLESCFAFHMRRHAGSQVSALQDFVTGLGASGAGCGMLLAVPKKGSACKRLHLFLRWMVRRDEVDPGGWTVLSPAELTVPLDTHMYRIGRFLGFTRRNQADGCAAREVTRGFRGIRPEDPVRYDFALAKFAMTEGAALRKLLEPHLQSLPAVGAPLPAAHLSPVVSDTTT